jgi:hypothetical protein
MTRLILTSMIAAGVMFAQAGNGSASGSAPAKTSNKVQTPASNSAKPAVKSNVHKPAKPVAKAPVAKAPVAKAPAAKVPVTKAPASKAPSTPAAKAPVSKTPAAKPVAKSNVKTGNATSGTPKSATGDQKSTGK